MDIKFNKNEDHNKLLISDLKHKLKKVHLGGGQKKIDKHHDKGKMTARERIDYLLDQPKKAIEIGAFAGDEMYQEYGGCPSGGVVVKIGKVSGKKVIVVANDATVKAGAWFPITGKRTSGLKKFLSRIIYRLFTLLIVLVYFYPCRTKFFLIKNTLVEFLEIML